MAGMSLFQGLWVPVVTPFDGDGAVDLAALERLAARLLADGVSGLVALGTTGEAATLTPSERADVVAACAQACQHAGRPLIVGVGSNDTAASVREIEAVANMDVAAAFLVVVPYYTRPSEPGIVEHFRTVAAHSPAPIVIYNIPYRTGRGLSLDALVELAGEAKIAGVKQAVGGLDAATLALLRRAPEEFEVLAGDDAFIAPTVLMGGGGAIAASAHLCTDLFVEMTELALAGRCEPTRRIAARLGPVVDAGFAEPNPAVFKAVLHAQGELSSPSLRSPMTQASPSGAARLARAVEEVVRC